MTRVLFVGQRPETVDFSDPAIPPGFSAEKIHAGIAIGMSIMAERGWQADLCLIPPDKTAALVLERQMATMDFPGFSGHVGVFVRLFQIPQDLRRLNGYDGALDCRRNQCSQISRPVQAREFCRSFS